MLLPEIEPFAQAHIEVINKIREEMLDNPIFVGDETYTITRADLDRWREQLSNTTRALFRFQVCMVDTFEEKERLHKLALDCRLHHK